MQNTPKYGLPQFIGTDLFNKEDFNKAFTDIDTAVGDLQDTVSSIGGGGVATLQEVITSRGTYDTLPHRLTGIDTSISNKVDKITGKVLSTNDYTNSAVTEVGKVASKLNTADLFNLIYPVGSVYISVSSTSPSTRFGGTWTRFGNGRALVGVDEAQTEFSTTEKTGGEKTHDLTDAEMQHKHTWDSTFTSTYIAGNGMQYTNGGSVSNVNQETSTIISNTATPHNNLQPYITCYMWKRTA